MFVEVVRLDGDARVLADVHVYDFVIEVFQGSTRTNMFIVESVIEGEE